MRATGFHCAKRATGTIGVRFTRLLFVVADIDDAAAGTRTFAVQKAETVFIVSTRGESAAAGCRIVTGA